MIGTYKFYMIFSWISFICFSPVYSQATNTLSAAEKKAGWVLLFDGISNNGWEKPGPEGSAPPGQWELRDSALYSANGDICTEKEYKNYEFKADWKVNKAGNSGIFWHTKRNVIPPYMSGPELAILDNENGMDRFDKKTTAGAAYGMYAPAEDVSNPWGEWNTSTLWINNLLVEHWLNGIKNIEFERYSPDWEQKLLSSKFSRSPWNPQVRGRELQGLICLQDHGGNLKVWFRNIKIREFTPGEKLSSPLITPDTGTVEDSLKIIMEAAITGAHIYYTTDGSTPTPDTTKANLYSSPFFIYQAQTLKAITVRDLFISSDPAIATFTTSQSPVLPPNPPQGFSTYIRKEGHAKKLIISNPLGNIKVSLVNIHGNIISTAPFSSPLITYDVSLINNQVIFLQVKSESYYFTQKLIL